MGTHGTILVKESKTGVILVNVYNQYDSDLFWLGTKLAKFLEGRTITDGMCADIRSANGADDLAAQIVCLLKGDPERAGGVYIIPSKFNLKNAEEYTYIIFPITKTETLEHWKTGALNKYESPTGQIAIKVYKYGKIIYDGLADNFSKFIDAQK